MVSADLNQTYHLLLPLLFITIISLITSGCSISNHQSIFSEDQAQKIASNAQAPIHLRTQYKVDQHKRYMFSLPKNTKIYSAFVESGHLEHHKMMDQFNDYQYQSLSGSFLNVTQGKTFVRVEVLLTQEKLKQYDILYISRFELDDGKLVFFTYVIDGPTYKVLDIIETHISKQPWTLNPNFNHDVIFALFKQSILSLSNY